MLILFYILGLLVVFYLLAVVCDEFFVESLDIISDRLKLTPDVAGATFMAIGSSAPEFFTSLFAVFRAGSEDVGSGTIVGSAIFNILVIIGASVLYRRVQLNWQPVVRDTLFYSLAILVLLWSFWDGHIIFWEAGAFVCLYLIYLIAVAKWKQWFPYQEKQDPIELVEEGLDKNMLARISKKFLGLVIPDAKTKPHLYLVTFGMSIVLIAVLSHILVDVAVHLAELIHVSPIIISLTVLAAGTSIPDLLSSMIVAKRGRGDMAVSNAIGSNTFDILIGLGLPWMLVLIWRGGSVPVATENLRSSIFLLFATLLAVFLLLALRQWKIGRKSGLILIFIYLVYLGYNIMSVVSSQ